MEILMHPVLRYWLLGAFFLAAAGVIGVHTSHPYLAVGLAAFGLGLIAAMVRPVRVSARPAAAASEEGAYRTSLEGLVGVLELPTVAIDTDQSVIAFNRPVADLFPSIVLGLPLSRMSRHPDLMKTLGHVAADGLPRSVEILDHLPNGRRLRVGVARVSSNIGDQPQTVILVQLRDLTEQDRLAQMRSDFIANASHELRTPLASLKGFIETLQGPAANDETARGRFLDIMSAQAGRMMRILDDLLSLSRIEMRAHVPPVGTVDMAALIREVVQGLEPLAEGSQIALELSLPNETLNVRGDRDELIQVLQNLVQNAIKYGHEGGHVRIALGRFEGAAAQRPRVRVEVKDDGPGIEAEHLPRLTERFYRVDTAQSRARGGTGLGLAIVKHILNRHRGDLRIESSVGVGSTFTVLLDEMR